MYVKQLEIVFFFVKKKKKWYYKKKATRNGVLLIFFNIVQVILTGLKIFIFFGNCLKIFRYAQQKKRFFDKVHPIF